MNAVISLNLKARRKQRGLTQDGLARESGLSRVSIANYERGKTQPDGDSLVRLARALRVPVDTLVSEPAALQNFRFRSDSAFRDDPATLTDLAEWSRSYAELETLCGQVPYAPESAPCNRLEGNEGLIRDVAGGVRRRLGLGEEPITNLFATLDRMGLKHLRRSVAKQGLFGVSACSDDSGAFVLVNDHGITIERQLFTAAHELGHLIFHRQDFGSAAERTKEEDKAREAVADFFAGHFLVPNVAFRREVGRWATPSNTQAIVQLKRHFRVSYLTVIRRWAELENREQGELIKRFRWHWRKATGQALVNHAEPAPLDRAEFPVNERFENLVRLAYLTDCITTSRAAELLGCSVMDLRTRAAQWGNDR